MVNPAVSTQKPDKVPEKLVKALIPFVLSRELMKGLGVLGKRHSPNTVVAVKDEAIRRCQPATEPFNTHHFAKFSLKRIQTPVGVATTDVLGERIYKRLLKEYAGQYTQGVFEGVSDPRLYEREYKDHLASKVLEAFEMPWFPADEEAQPIPLMVDLSVRIEELSSERDLPIYALSESELYLRLGKKPPFRLGKEIVVQFSPLPHSERREEALYKVSQLQLERSGKRSYWLLVLKLVGGFNSPWYQKLSPYLFNARETTPAIPSLEQQRVKQDLYRDIAALNSPWLSIFSESNNGVIEPSLIKCTPANTPTLTSLTADDGVSINQRTWCIALEEAKTGPSYIIRFTEQYENGDEKEFSTTLQTAQHYGFASTLIARGLKHGTLKIQKVVLQELSQTSRLQIKSTYGVNSAHGRQLQKVSHLVSVLDISNVATGKRVEYPDNGQSIPPLFAREGSSYQPAQLRQPEVERRREPRYQITANCEVAISMFNRVASKVLDISARGLRLRLSEPPPELRKKRVRLRFKSMGLFFKAYDVVNYDAANGLLQLRAPASSEQSIQASFEQFRQKQGLMFSGKNLHESQQYLFDILVRVGGIHAPCSHILLGPRSLSFDKRLIMVVRGQATGLNSPLLPERDSMVSVAKLLADTMHGKPASKLLSSLTKRREAQATVGLITLKGGRDVLIPATLDSERETYALAGSKQRKSIEESHQITLFSSQCDALSQYHIDLRLALLMDVDVPKVRSIEKHINSVSHVLTLVDTSRFLQLVLEEPGMSK